MVARLALAAILVAAVWPIAGFAEDAAPAAAAAAPAPKLDSGDTAWMLTSTALVLFMTIPGLALFYGGLVRTKNVLSILMQCFVITALVTILWTLVGYSLCFEGGGGFDSYIGTLKKAFLMGIGVDTLAPLALTIPESVYVCYQMTFAIITPALIIGAFAERMKFSAMLIFMTLWSLLVYSPICHMVWSPNGALGAGGLGALDYAGGTVVHINAGIAALASVLVIGKRKGHPTTPFPPHNMTMTITGASMLWVGWFGFNAGSAVAANGAAGMAMAVTQIATAMATLSWMGVEWIKQGKPSALGAASGAVAGLVAITPASGFVGPVGALAIGLAAGAICFWGVTGLKKMFGYDDALDVVGVHCLGGLAGAMLTGVFALHQFGGFSDAADKAGLVGQLIKQATACGVTLVYSFVASLILLKIVDVLVGLRVTDAEETEGLDTTQHNEVGYNFSA
ncbi:MAG: ammonium transporter [Candidatus Hydrogenedentes bacterium]|nr:ammonium transporter [Candidatus Hydrogenedentota bacterium]